jgi:hypothetical protein
MRMAFFIDKKLNIVLIIIALMYSYLRSQDLRWIYRYDGDPTPNYYSVIKYGYNSNVFASANIIANGVQHITVFNISTLGDSVWIYQNPERGIVHDLDCDPKNNVYIGGMVFRQGGGRDSVSVICVDSSGNERWVYGRPMADSFSWPDICGIVYGNDNNIYTATTRYIAYEPRGLLIRLDTLGNERWRYTYPETSEMMSVIYGFDNNILVGGRYNEDFAVFSFHTDSVFRWVYHNLGEGIASTLIEGVDSNIYAIGYGWRSGYVYEDLVVVSLDTAGNERWNYRYSAAFDLPDRALSITQGTDGILYIAGYCCLSGYNGEMVVISLDTFGNERWIYHLNRGSSPIKIVYGLDDKLYIAGNWYDNITYDDVFLICLDTLGNEMWRYHYDDAGDELGQSMTSGDDNNLYVSGYECVSGAWDDFFVLSVNIPLAIEEDPNRKSRDLLDISLNSIQKINLDFTIRHNKASHLFFYIYDLLGRKLVEWQEFVPKGNHSYQKSLSDFTNGVYFFCIRDSESNIINQKKIVFIK